MLRALRRFRASFRQRFSLSDATGRRYFGRLNMLSDYAISH